ncbi:MAG: ABC transporter permease [Acidimicrobiia bacterium]|nr:ABC transporter permease [Acidimicrobiia bacterium]
MTWTGVRRVVGPPLAAVGLALLVAALVLVVSGADPIVAFGNIWEYGSRLETVIESFNRATPLYLSGIAFAIAMRMNLFQIGVEGQYILAAFFAAYVGAGVGSLFPPLHIAIILATAMIVGVAWAGLAGWMKVTRNVHEVISTIMLNAIAVAGVVSFLLGRWKIESESLDTRLGDIATTGWFPSLNPIVELVTREIKRVELTGFILVAALVGVAYHLIINRSRLGYDLRATGANPWAAEASGVPPKRTIVLAMLLSGAVAGLVGMADLLGDQHFYSLRFPQGLGFAGIAVALLGRNHAVGAAVAAVAFGWLERASGVLEVRGDAPREIVTIMVGVIILFAVIAYALAQRRRRIEAAAAASAQVESPATAEAEEADT